jgi:small subunit ribosomal protein S2e
VKEGKIGSIEEIFLFSLPVKEAEIIDYFLKDKLQDEVMKIMPVQKQSSAGQRTRFKAFVAVGDNNGHIGLGVKCSSEVANAIRGAITAAKLNVAPVRYDRVVLGYDDSRSYQPLFFVYSETMQVRRGFWGRKQGLPHTVPCKVTGKCGSVRVRLIPAPRGTGLVSSPAGKKLMHMAGIDDCYTSSQGHTRTMGNFIKALFYALRNTYGYLSPELWKDNALVATPYQEHTDFLAKKHI